MPLWSSWWWVRCTQSDGENWWFWWWCCKDLDFGGFFGFGSSFTLWCSNLWIRSFSSFQNAVLPLYDKFPDLLKSSYALQDVIVRIYWFTLATVSFNVSLNLRLSLQTACILDFSWKDPIHLSILTKMIFVEPATAPGFKLSSAMHFRRTIILIWMTIQLVMSASTLGASLVERSLMPSIKSWSIITSRYLGRWQFFD